MQLRRQLVLRVGQWQLSLVQQVQSWIVVVDQRQRQELQQRRRRLLQVPAHQKHRPQQARLQGQRWLLRVAQRRTQLVQQLRLAQVQAHRWTQQFRSLVRQPELQCCAPEAVSRRW